jgi:uncharacterized protein YfkK (UPF0435 family)
MDFGKEIALMEQRMDNMEKKLEEMDGKLDVLTQSLLNPDDGFVSRVNKNTEFRQKTEDLMSEIYAMKRWRKNMDVVIKGLIGAVTAGLAKIFFF